MVAGKQTLPNHDAGISIGVAAHLALGTRDEWGSRGIAFGGLSRTVPCDQRRTACTVAAGVARRDTAGHDALIPGFVLGRAEDFSP